MENSDPKTSNSLKMVGSLVVVLLVVATVAWMANGNKNLVPDTTSNTNTQPENMVKAEPSSYKDGSYTAQGGYVSPAGQEKVDVTLVLTDGKVSEAQFVATSENPISKKLQGQFDQGYKELVVGKSLDELSLTVVNGSSLTPKGFMDAVEKIKAQASQG